MPAPTTTEDVWVPSGGAFIEGELVHTSAEEPAPAVRRADGEPFDGDAPSAAECLPRAALPPGGYEDNTQLTHLHEAGLLENLRARYAEGHIYTYTGTVLVAVNPYAELPLYGPEAMERYRGRPMRAVPPHPYAVADRALRALTREREDQALVVSGESGAGKTETCKTILRYLAYRSMRQPAARALGALGDGAAAASLEAQVLAAGPILEAFGNAATVRNDNSSRFGKLVRTLVSPDSCEIGGAKIDTYLLERSRVVSQPAGERSFHVLYQLCARAEAAAVGYGSESDTRDALVPAALGLDRGAAAFAYLTGGGRTTIDGVADAEALATVVRALETMGLAPGTVHAVWRLLAAVLHLGNVGFRPAGTADGRLSVQRARAGGEEAAAAEGEGGGGAYATADADAAADGDALSLAAQLLGVSSEDLEGALTTRAVQALSGREGACSVCLDEQQATAARDSLAKTLYSSLFGAVVGGINARLGGGGGGQVHGAAGTNVSSAVLASLAADPATRRAAADAGGREECADGTAASAPPAAAMRSISILDIFGFECFEKNGFEQLLINYANERLQRFFLARVLEDELELCRSEGVRCPSALGAGASAGGGAHVGDATVALLDGRPDGILRLLADEANVPRATDETFARRVHAAHGAHARLRAPKLGRAVRGARALGADGGFVVRHFAGDVTYTAAGFLEKDADSAHAELAAIAHAALARLELPSGGAALRTPAASIASTPAVSRQPSLTHLPSLVGATAPAGGAGGAPAVPPLLGLRRGASSSHGGARGGRSLACAFASELDGLLKTLRGSSTQFVRCVKPNEQMRARAWDGATVLAQLRSAGLGGVLALMGDGYPARVPYARLAQRFEHLAPLELRGLPPQDLCAALLGALSVPRTEYALGVSTAFFKAGQLATVEELRAEPDETRDAEIGRRMCAWVRRRRWRRAAHAVRAAGRLGRVVRMRRAARALRRLARAALAIKRAWGTLAARARATVAAARAATRLQAAARRAIAVRARRAAIGAAVRLQAAKRGASARAAARAARVWRARAALASTRLQAAARARGARRAASAARAARARQRAEEAMAQESAAAAAAEQIAGALEQARRDSLARREREASAALDNARRESLGRREKAAAEAARALLTPSSAAVARSSPLARGSASSSTAAASAKPAKAGTPEGVAAALAAAEARVAAEAARAAEARAEAARSAELLATAFADVDGVLEAADAERRALEETSAAAQYALESQLQQQRELAEVSAARQREMEAALQAQQASLQEQLDAQRRAYERRMEELESRLAASARRPSHEPADEGAGGRGGHADACKDRAEGGGGRGAAELARWRQEHAPPPVDDGAESTHADGGAAHGAAYDDEDDFGSTPPTRQPSLSRAPTHSSALQGPAGSRGAPAETPALAHAASEQRGQRRASQPPHTGPSRAELRASAPPSRIPSRSSAAGERTSRIPCHAPGAAGGAPPPSALARRAHGAEPHCAAGAGHTARGVPGVPASALRAPLAATHCASPLANREQTPRTGAAAPKLPPPAAGGGAPTMPGASASRVAAPRATPATAAGARTPLSQGPATLSAGGGRHEHSAHKTPAWPSPASAARDDRLSGPTGLRKPRPVDSRSKLSDAQGLLLRANKENSGAVAG